MKLTAVFAPAPEGGYTAFVEEIPGAISQGETLDEARENLADALRMVLECNRELAREQPSENFVREPFELAAVGSSSISNGICARSFIATVHATRFGGMA